MAKLITVFWRDIPSQVMSRKGRETRKVLLSPRFQEAIDRAAMRAGKGASDAYMSEWRRETVRCDDADQSPARLTPADVRAQAVVGPQLAQARVAVSAFRGDSGCPASGLVLGGLQPY